MKALKATAAGGLAALLAACQTQRPVDPLSTVLVAGNYQVLANCFATSQPGAVAASTVDRTGFRSVTVTTPAPSRAATETLIETGNADLAVAYSTAFQEAIGNNTKVSGTSLGPAVVPFYWRDVVIRQLRTCTGNPTLS